MEMDLEKLIACVQAKPALYDHNLKDYSNKNVIDQQWEEIGEEMECSAGDCRQKWHNLRSSYSRYLRTTKNLPSGSRIKRKKWYLADAMSFLGSYLNHHKKSTVNTAVKEGSVVENEVDRFSLEDGISSQSSSSLDSLPTLKEKRKSSADMLAGPMKEFLESRSTYQESPMMHFFKGVLPDIEKLSQRRQRIFKTKLLELVNNLADEEEAEATMANNIVLFKTEDNFH